MVHAGDLLGRGRCRGSNGQALRRTGVGMEGRICNRCASAMRRISASGGWAGKSAAGAEVGLKRLSAVFATDIGGAARTRARRGAGWEVGCVRERVNGERDVGGVAESVARHSFPIGNHGRELTMAAGVVRLVRLTQRRDAVR